MDHHHLGFTRSDERARPAFSRAPALATLEGFLAATAGREGVQIDELDPLTELSVRTRNSRYEILVTDPHHARILIRGGRGFLTPTPATLRGSTLGGSCLKVGWIGEGFSLEIGSADFPVVTSPVVDVQVRSTSGPSHFMEGTDATTDMAPARGSDHARAQRSSRDSVCL